MCARPLSDAKASIDQLPWIIFDAASRTCAPTGRQDKCGVAIIWCTVSHLMRRKTNHGSFRLGPVMMGSTASETIGAILAATRC